MAKAYISLYEATHEIDYLNKAKKISSSALEYFWDEEKKGFFFTPHDHEQLFTKIKEATDGSVPGGNAVFAHNFLRLYAITTEDSYRRVAVDLMQVLGTIVNDNPVGAASWFAAYHFWWAGNQQLVLVGSRDNADIYREINGKYLPNKVVLWLGPNGLPKSLAAHQGKKMLNNLPTLYICQNFSCRLPLNDIKQIITRLDSL